MSYSFSAQASSKTELKAKVSEQLANVVKNQALHAADCVQAQAAAESFIDLLADDATRDIAVSISGSLWGTEAGLQQSNVSVTANITPRT